jgi:hypothetical protein
MMFFALSTGPSRASARLLLALLLCILPTLVRAQSSPRFVVETVSATSPRIALQALGVDGKVRAKSEDTPEREWAGVVALRRPEIKLPALLTRNFVCLNNGDRLPLDADASAQLDGSKLKVWPAASLPELRAKGLALFVPNVEFVFWSIPEDIENPHRFFMQLESQTRKRDAVYLVSGDRLDGTVIALSGKEGCVTMVGDRKVHTSWSRLAGIAWNTERQAKLHTKGAYWRGVLEGGARVNLNEITFDAKSRRWAGKTQFGVALDLPEAALLDLERKMGEAVDLSDLSPARYEHRPFLGATWPLVKNMSVTDGMLRIGGNAYETGLGTHAACRITYNLDKQYQRFMCVAGIDESAPRGRAIVALELDGKRIDINDGKELTAQTPPVPVHADLRDVRTLTLIVEHGSFGDVQAHVNFAQACLTK